MRDRILYGVIALLMAAGLLTAIPAFAQTQGAGADAWGGPGHTAQRAPGVFGTVSAINGDSITVQSKGFGKNAAATTYTVDATNATVTKNGSASSVSAIAVSDTLMVQGTVSGDNVTATKINDGMPQGGFGKGPGGMASSTRPQGMGKGPGGGAIASLQGNGEPVIGGSVSAISGDTLTVSNTSNVTYSVDATNATVLKDNATSSLASIATGDKVLVQGTVNGTSVTASSIIDQGAASNTSSSTGAPAMMHGMGGVFGAIGGFFQHLFGFF